MLNFQPAREIGMGDSQRAAKSVNRSDRCKSKWNTKHRITAGVPYHRPFQLRATGLMLQFLLRISGWRRMIAVVSGRATREKSECCEKYR